MLMAILGGEITGKFTLLLCYIFEFSKINLYYLHSNNTVSPSRDWGRGRSRAQHSSGTLLVEMCAGKDLAFPPPLRLSSGFPHERFFSTVRA